MIAEQSKPTPTSDAAHRASFFRQSGWLMIANVGGGALMWAVHFLSKAIPESEYGSFGVFLAVIMVLPTMPLQMVLAQQTAKGIAHHREHEVAGVIRLFCLGILAIWAVAAVLVLVFQRTILERWQMTDPVGLWITLPILLMALLLPVFWGVLQGQQNFLWLGWSMMVSAIGRITIAVVAVLILHTYAAGMMGGVLIGYALACAVAIWPTRKIWLARPEPFDRPSLLRQVIPLVLGFLGFQILFTADTMFVKAYFPQDQAGFYVSAGTLSRALMWLVLPLASVMFPRIVHAAARSEKSNLMGMVLAGTAVLAVVGAACLSLVGPFVVRLVYKESYVQVASAVLPWYAFAMVPLAIANVLLNNLLAKPDSALVPSVCVLLLALGYMGALTQFHASLVMVLQTVGLCNLLLLGLCAWFTYRPAARAAAA